MPAGHARGVGRTADAAYAVPAGAMSIMLNRLFMIIPLPRPDPASDRARERTRTSLIIFRTTSETAATPHTLHRRRCTTSPDKVCMLAVALLAVGANDGHGRSISMASGNIPQRQRLHQVCYDARISTNSSRKLLSARASAREKLLKVFQNFVFVLFLKCSRARRILLCLRPHASAPCARVRL